MLGSKVAPRTSLHALSGVLQQTWMQKIWCTKLWTETFVFELYRVKLLQVNWNILDLRTWPHWQNVSFELHDWWAGLQNDCSLLPAGLQGATQLFCNTVILRLRRSWIWKLLRVLQLHWVGKYRTQQIPKQCLDVSMRSHLRCLHTAGCKYGYPGSTPTEFSIRSYICIVCHLGRPLRLLQHVWSNSVRNMTKRRQVTGNEEHNKSSLFLGTPRRPHCGH